jgi:hypothetical protein
MVRRERLVVFVGTAIVSLDLLLRGPNTREKMMVRLLNGQSCRKVQNDESERRDEPRRFLHLAIEGTNGAG